MNKKKQPTVAELKKIMADAADKKVVFHPDGSVSVENNKSLRVKLHWIVDWIITLFRVR